LWSSDQTLRVISLNCNGLRRLMRGGHVQELETWDPDIVLLQEIKLREPDPERNMGRKNDLKKPLEALQKRFGYRRYNCGRGGTALHGTAVLSKYTADSVSTDLGDAELDNEGRTQLIEFRTFGILNSYVPFQGLNNENIEKRQRYLQKVEARIHRWQRETTTKHKPLIWTADLNGILNTNDVCVSDLGTPGRTQETMQELSDLIRRTHLHDLYEGEDGEPGATESLPYTWYWSPQERALGQGARLDYVLATAPPPEHSEQEYPKARRLRHLRNSFVSDHLPLLFEIEHAGLPLSTRIATPEPDDVIRRPLPDMDPVSDLEQGAGSQGVFPEDQDELIPNIARLLAYSPENQEQLHERLEDVDAATTRETAWTQLQTVEWGDAPQRTRREEARTQEEPATASLNTTTSHANIPFLRASCEGVPVNVMLDSGAGLSVVTKPWLQAHCPQLPVNATGPPGKENQSFQFVDGTLQPACGYVNIPLEVRTTEGNTATIPWGYFVVNSTSPEAILGGDFLVDRNAVLSYARRALTFETTLEDDTYEDVPLYVRNIYGGTATTRVATLQVSNTVNLQNDTLIEANHEKWVRVVHPRTKPTGSYLEPHVLCGERADGQHGAVVVMVHKGLLPGDACESLVKVYNPNSVTVRVARGQAIGELQQDWDADEWSVHEVDLREFQQQRPQDPSPRRRERNEGKGKDRRNRRTTTRGDKNRRHDTTDGRDEADTGVTERNETSVRQLKRERDGTDGKRTKRNRVTVLPC
jgi:exodeoxyribonuclease-3